MQKDYQRVEAYSVGTSHSVNMVVFNKRVQVWNRQTPGRAHDNHFASLKYAAGHMVNQSLGPTLSESHVHIKGAIIPL